MTVTPLKRFARSPARQVLDGKPSEKLTTSLYDGEFYSSLSHLNEASGIPCVLKGYDIAIKRPSTAEERRLARLVDPIQALSAGASKPLVASHLLTFRRNTSTMRNASSITSLPSYLSDDGTRESGLQCPRLSPRHTTAPAAASSGAGSTTERSFVTVNYQSTRTILGRKRSFRGKKVHRSTGSTSSASSPKHDEKVKKMSESTDSQQGKTTSVEDCQRSVVGAPTGLRIEQHSRDGATLAWECHNSSSSEVLGYTVYVNDEVEAFVEGHQNRSIELFELQRGKVYKASVATRSSHSAESAQSEPLQFLITHNRPQPIQCGQSRHTNNSLSYSLPTLLGDDDSDSDFGYTPSPDDNTSCQAFSCGDSPPERSPNVNITILGKGHHRSRSSGLGASTPPSPQSDSSSPGSAFICEPKQTEKPALPRFNFQHGALAGWQGRPASVEPFMLTKKSPAHTRSCRETLVTPLPARPTSAAAPGRRLAFYCTAV